LFEVVANTIELLKISDGIEIERLKNSKTDITKPKKGDLSRAHFFKSYQASHCI